MVSGFWGLGFRVFDGFRVLGVFLGLLKRMFTFDGGFWIKGCTGFGVFRVL